MTPVCGHSSCRPVKCLQYLQSDLTNALVVWVHLYVSFLFCFFFFWGGGGGWGGFAPYFLFMFVFFVASFVEIPGRSKTSQNRYWSY